MPTHSERPQDLDNNGTRHEDEPVPRASDDTVLEETARLAREGRRELEADPRESKRSPE